MDNIEKDNRPEIIKKLSAKAKALTVKKYTGNNDCERYIRLDDAIKIATNASTAELEKKLSKLEKHKDILVDALADIKATNDGESIQPISFIIAECLDELSRVGGTSEWIGH